MSALEGHLYEFGEFRLNTAERLLLRKGQPVPLAPKVFDTLVVLVQNSGHLLDKDRLMHELWPNAFVEEVNLSVNISALRKALGESQDGWPYIETVSKQGYRFTAEVRKVENGDDDLVVHNRVRARMVTEEVETGTTIGRAQLAPAEHEQSVTVTHAAGISTKRKIVPAVMAASVLVLGLVLAAAYFRNASRKAGTSAPSARINSMAVLPFKPLVAESRDEALELGMAETLINRLSNIRQLNVPPISTVRKYRGLEQDPIAVGRELKVESVLDGNIQRLGDRLRVTVRLTSIKDGSTLWAETFNEKFTDIFTVQDSISERVAGALSLKLSGEEQRRLAKRYTDDAEAYALYLKGRYFWNKRTKEGVTKGIEYFQQAVEKDPNYGLAYTGLADCYSSLGFSFDVGSLSPSEAMPKAKAAAIKALELDDTLAEAHTSLAFIRLNYDWDWPGAEREFKRALELNPNYDNAHHWYSHYLMAMGRSEESLAESKRALELDQLGLIINVHLGWYYLYAHQYDLATDQLKKTLEMDPNYGLTHWYLGQAYEQTAMYVEAETELRKAKDLLKENVGVEADTGYTYAISGKRDDAEKVIDKLKQLSKQGYVSSYNMALIYAGLGEKDQAFNWLESAYKERSDLLVYLKVDPRLDNLRSDPRFAELMRRVGLPQ